MAFGQITSFLQKFYVVLADSFRRKIIEKPPTLLRAHLEFAFDQPPLIHSWILFMNPLFRPFVAFHLKLQYSTNTDNLLDITTHRIAPKDFTAHTIAVLTLNCKVLQYVNLHYAAVLTLLKQICALLIKLAV